MWITGKYLPRKEITMNLRDVIERYAPGCEQEAQDRRMMLKYMDTFDDTLLRTNETAHFTASAWVVNTARDRLLMVYHNIYNSWSWTGGHADGEENLVYETAHNTYITESRLKTAFFIFY